MKKYITQIYEIQTSCEAMAAVAAGIDHIGSVVISSTDWKVPSIRESIQLVAQTAAKSSLILLYNQLEVVCASLAYYRPDLVHFCENLADAAEADCQAMVLLQERIHKDFPEIQIMRTIPIPHTAITSPEFSFLELAKLFEPVSDYFLIDTFVKDPAGKQKQPVDGFVGITGKTCDWAAARKLVNNRRIPVILAGGLSAENVYAAIRIVRPAGVDSCTLTNVVDSNGKPVRFQKDFAKVAKFVAEVRRAESDFLLQ